MRLIASASPPISVLNIRAIAAAGCGLEVFEKVGQSWELMQGDGGNLVKVEEVANGIGKPPAILYFRLYIA